MVATDVKVYVPAMDFDDSLAFYEAVGWTVNWVSDAHDYAELELGDTRFYLQNYYNRAWANNFMMLINVDDAAAWYEHIAAVIKKGNWKHARLKEPSEQSFGALVTPVWDPSGVLLHFAQFHNAD